MRVVLVAAVLMLVGFDHIVHDRDLDVKGVGVLPCARCHVENKGKLVGKPGHAACFGSCHGSSPVSPKRRAKISFGDSPEVCTSCHAGSLQGKPFTGKLPVTYPPYTADPDFNIAFGHKQHGSLACTLCHDLRSNSKPRVHQRCASCHDGSRAQGRGPAMAECVRCHPRAVGKPQPPELRLRRDTLVTTFSHATHAGRGPAGRECLTCHAAIKTTDDSELPRPTAQDCATRGCHDAKAAFAPTHACTRCHEKAPEYYEVRRPTARFTHAGAHAPLLQQRTCNACHPLSPRGDVVVIGHSACTECHAQDFGARDPKICGACHNATEPWRKLVADRALPERTEFGATLEHDKHAQQSCETCHRLRTPSSQLRPARGHASCIGQGCHALTSGPAPRFETCDGCHRSGLAAQRAQMRLEAAWSVRRAFDHSTHRQTPDKQALACTACHTQLGGMLLDMATPAKATCLPCHDAGKAAFKLTGTTCTRCHEGGT